MDVAEPRLLEEEKGSILIIIMLTKALHRAAIPLRSIAVGELDRWVSLEIASD